MEFNQEKEVKEAYNNKFKNKIFGLLCEFEKGREWEKFLDSILIELQGWPEENKTINFYTMFYKLSSLTFLNYKYFRTTIFDILNLVDKSNGVF